MEMEELEISILRDGTIQVRTRGFSGSRCLAATKELEEATGTVIQRDLTSAYYEQNTTVKDNKLNFCRGTKE